MAGWRRQPGLLLSRASGPVLSVSACANGRAFSAADTVDPYTVSENGNARNLKRQAGQGMTEYIIVVALVAVAAIAVYQYFGQVVRAQVAAMAHELSGEDGSASRARGGRPRRRQRAKPGRVTKAYGGNVAGGK